MKVFFFKAIRILVLVSLVNFVITCKKVEKQEATEQRFQKDDIVKVNVKPGLVVRDQSSLSAKKISEIPFETVVQIVSCKEKFEDILGLWLVHGVKLNFLIKKDGCFRHF
ncbi:hypothetical protein LEP1GSC163_1383 [Leptospira santarosai str. CBC379]|nr:hypothetical protein LEP1GSC163_1383 [Leptospira santarosai str. CBC379]